MVRVAIETVSGHAVSEFIKEAFPYPSRIKVNPKASQHRDAKEDLKDVCDIFAGLRLVLCSFLKIFLRTLSFAEFFIFSSIST